MKNSEKKLNLSLLYVEDECFIRQNAVEFLADQFEVIYEAEDGKQALELYKEMHPDIIITDIEMPGMNGLELCRNIRKNDDKTPIIITTAFTDQDYLFEAIELNLVKYLTKPIVEEALKEALENCIKRLENQENSIIKLTCEHTFDLFNQALFYRDNFVKLTSHERKLLTLLIDQKERVVCYREIENHIWDGEYMSEDALKALVKNLRKKISKETIQNHSKLGYKISFDHG